MPTDVQDVVRPAGPNPSYYRARYYDPSSGRFLSEDPVQFDGGTDFYNYAGNEPTTFVDPEGLQHRPGGPEHPEPWKKLRCKWTDDCSTLSSKIDRFKGLIAGHLAWDAAHNTDFHSRTDIPNMKNGLERCIEIHRSKCTDKGPCKAPDTAPAPEPAGDPRRVPAPSLSPQQANGVANVMGTIGIIIIILLSPVGA